MVLVKMPLDVSLVTVDNPQLVVPMELVRPAEEAPLVAGRSNPARLAEEPSLVAGLMRPAQLAVEPVFAEEKQEEEEEEEEEGPVMAPWAVAEEVSSAAPTRWCIAYSTVPCTGCFGCPLCSPM